MRSRTIRRVIMAALLAASSTSGVASAKDAVPQTITNQGRLFDDKNAPIDGTLDVVFAIYDAADAQVPIWSEQHSVTFDQGFYAVSLGDTVPFGAKVFDGSVRYFGVTIGAEPELLPRAPMQSVPYALFAGDVRGDIHPSSVSVGGDLVINENGQWVGDPTGLVGPTDHPPIARSR